MPLPPIPKWLGISLVLFVPWAYFLIGKLVLHWSDDQMFWIAVAAGLVVVGLFLLDWAIRRWR